MFNKLILIISLIFPLVLPHPKVYKVVVNLEPGGSENSPENTYERIRSALGPHSIEVPDCSHTPQEHHIREVNDPDPTLDSKPIFIFTVHAEPDNDQCNNENKQRTEIAVSEHNPPNGALIKGPDQSKNYVWSFYVPTHFTSFKQFTDIHQIQAKTKNGPIITVLRIVLMTTFDGKTLIQVKTPGKDIKCSGDFTPYLGKWMEVDEEVTMGSTETDSFLAISITPKKGKEVSNPNKNNNLFLTCLREGISGLEWKDDYVHARPKWGIKRRKFKGRTDVQIYYEKFQILAEVK